MQSPAATDVPERDLSDDVIAEIVRLGHTAETVEVFYRQGMECITRHFGAAIGIVSLELPVSSVRAIHCSNPDHQEAWRKLLEPTVLEAQVDACAVGRVLRVESTSQEVALCAAPLQVPGRGTCGALGLVLHFESRGLAQANLAELRAVAALLDLSSPDPASASSSDGVEETGRGLVASQKAAQFGSLREFAYALTNGLRPKLDCDQIAMGSVVGRRVRLLSISGLDEPNFKSVGITEVRQAMEECLDVCAPIVSQERAQWGDDDVSTQHALHRQWRAATRNSSVASVPLMSGTRCTAVLSLRRPSDRPFTREEVDSVVQLAGTMGAAVLLHQRAERSVLRHVRENVSDGIRRVMAPGRFGQKLLMLGLASALAWFCFGTLEHDRVVSCSLQPRETVQLAAPFQARLAESFVRAGDSVEKGDLLYRFATDELELEHEELLADIEVRQVEIDQAVAAGNLVEASLSKARKNLLATRLAGVQRRIEESRVHAPEDGTILRGDLSHQIGQMMPQGELLFELAPGLRYFIELEIPESEVAEIGVGQELRFATNARPDRPLSCVVRRVPFAAEVREGRNVFVAEAECVNELPSWTRAGMEGIGKVDVGRRSVWGVALKRVVDSIYRIFWL